jgi:hypothetical protein
MKFMRFLLVSLLFLSAWGEWRGGQARPCDPSYTVQNDGSVILKKVPNQSNPDLIMVCFYGCL